MEIFLKLVGGLVVLTLGAELLVRYASAFALSIRVSPLVVGLTVVAFGTSAPELAVSVQSAFEGRGEIALGNVIGSNILNVLFVLGASALITPLAVSQQLLRFDVPLMIGVSVLVMVMGWDGQLGRVDGVILTCGVIAYCVFSIVQSRKESGAVQAEYAEEFTLEDAPAPENALLRVVVQITMVCLGLALLVQGSNWFVDGAVELARLWGMSELLIGLTIVAAGTSLPEVATSLVAAFKGERDIAVGNIVGSNIFNILAVLGVASAAAPQGIPIPDKALQFDLPVMIAVAVACMPIFFIGHRISRWEGGLFLGYLTVYTILKAADEAQLAVADRLVTAMIWLVIPITVITLSIGVYRTWKHPPEARPEGPAT